MRFKQYINTLFACGLLAMTVVSCTSDDITDTGGNGQGELPEGAITFKIAGINTGAVETRAVGDPVIATEAENRVNDLAIFVFTSATNSANDADYVYHSYWTNGFVNSGVVDEDRNTFRLGGSGQFRTATIVLPKTIKYAKFLFLTANPRLFRMDATGENATELTRVYNEESMGAEIHLYDNHSFDGMTLADVKALQMVRAEAAANVPVSKLGYTLNLASSYFDLDAADAADALDMTGISTNAVDVSSTSAQNMDVTLYRNVVRLDVNNADALDITDLKIVNVPATTGVENGAPNMAILGGTPASTYSLMKEVGGALTCQGSRYCYPANNVAPNELKLQVTIGTSVTPIELSLETVDGDKVSLLRNHRYIVNLSKNADNNVDANIVVVDWNVGDNVSVDMEAGQNTAEPTINLITGTADMNSDNALAFWQGTTKVTTRMHDSYVYGGGDVSNPAYYPWLRFDMPRVGSLGIKAYAYGEELDYLNYNEVAALGNPYNAIESENGETVRNELAAVPVGMACSYWLVLQNNYAPEKRRMVKVEIGNTLYSSFGIYTPSLMRFAETNVAAAGGTLVAFPEGGYDNPYGLVNIPAGDASRGQSVTTHTLPAEYALPAKDHMRNITPDYAAVGTFAQYNGVNVYSVTQPDGTVVYYSGSKADKTVIKLVVQKATGATMTGVKYVSGTMWKYVSTAQGDYLKVMQVRTADESATYKNYTSMHDFFSQPGTGPGVVSRYFPAAATGDTYYLGDGGCAMKFNADGVVFVETYAGAGYLRPVQTHLVWDEPAPVIVTNGNSLVLDSGWTMSDGANTEIGIGG